VLKDLVMLFVCDTIPDDPEMTGLVEGAAFPDPPPIVQPDRPESKLSSKMATGAARAAQKNKDKIIQVSFILHKPLQ
jgi:hypothetical protein